MCGILGIIAPNATPEWRFQVIRSMLRDLKTRGRDATGIAFVDPEAGMVVMKDGVDADDFTKSEDFRELESSLPPIVIGHTRGASRFGRAGYTYTPGGTKNEIVSGPENNDNNHPFYSDESGICLVHNGLVDDEFWRDTAGKKNGILYPCLGTTDSEAILRVLETFFLIAPDKDFLQDHIDNLAFNMSGDYSLAILREDSPDKIWLVRNSRPLDIAYCKKHNAIVFGSTETAIKSALKETNYVWDYFVSHAVPQGTVFNTVVDDSAVEVSILPPLKSKRTNRFKFRTIPIEPCSSTYKYHKKMAEIRVQEELESSETPVLSEEQTQDEEQTVAEVTT